MMNKEVAFHIHTTKSDGVEDPKNHPRLAQKVGINFVVFTDHDNSEAADEAASEAQRIGIDNITFVHGAEISTGEGHLVVIAKKPFGVIPLFLSLEKTIGKAREMECLVIAPHVGFGPPPASIPPAVFRRLEKHNLLPQGIEVRLPYFSQRHIRQTEDLSFDFGLARFGAEDDHLGNFGRILTSFPGETLDDFFKAVEERKTGIIERKLSLRRIPPEKRIARIILSLFKGLDKKIINSPNLVQTWIELWRERN